MFTKFEGFPTLIFKVFQYRRILTENKSDILPEDDTWNLITFYSSDPS